MLELDRREGTLKQVKKGRSTMPGKAYRMLGLVRLQIAHEVQSFQHLVHLALAALAAGCLAEATLALLVSNLLPVALLQQGLTQSGHLHIDTVMHLIQEQSMQHMHDFSI